MLKKEEKTGYSEISVAAFVTSGALGVLPFFGLDISSLQATNLGACIAAAIGFAVRQYVKRKGE